MSWTVLERPGYFGTSRDEIHASYDSRFGKGNWRIAWEFGGQIIQRPEALQIYEDGYYEFFKSRPKVLRWITSLASDVYDTAESNVLARFSYDIQETNSNHLHDVAIRRAVLRNGAWFGGDRLIEVRTKGGGAVLSPCKIPFHLPHLIFPGETLYKGKPRDFSANPPWWITMGVDKSVEQFYQQNKVLEVLV